LAIQDPNDLDMMILVGVGTHSPAECRASMAASNADRYGPEWWKVMRDRHAYDDGQIREIAGYLRGLAETEGCSL